MTTFKLPSEDAQYRLLVESITDYAIFMLDLDGVVMSWNSGAERLKGYKASAILGKNFSSFYTIEDKIRGEPQRALETAALAGRFESEGWRVRNDRSRFWANVVIDPIRSSEGILLGFAKITRDVTEHKEAQAALFEAKSALFHSQKMDALGQLTGGVAHDFNNLLGAVLGSLELASKRLPNDLKLKQLIDNAIKGAQRGTYLTRRMLTFAHQNEVKPESIHVPSLVQGMLDLLQSSVGTSTIIETQIPFTLSTIRGDPNQLELALLNLALNARDAIPENGRIIISLREEHYTPDRGTAGKYACISVADTGEGMDEATLSRAMEPFYTTKGSGKGTGLGLSLVHGIMVQAGGRLVLKSMRGKGTTVELWFPIEKTDNVDLRSDAAVETQLPIPLTAHTTLAVDDDGLILMTLVAMLEDLGHTVFEATSGKKALEILRREKTIDLMVTDQSMPQMTGAKLLETVVSEWPNLKVILATGYTERPPGTDVNLIKLTKPYREEELARAIAQAFEVPVSNVLKFPKTLAP